MFRATLPELGVPSVENLGYLEIFRQRWLVLVLAVALGVGSAAIVAFSIPSSFTATATLFLSVKDSSATLAERSQFSQARVASYPDLVHSEKVLRPTINDLGLGLSVPELSGMVSATNPDNTVLIDVNGRAGNGGTAAAIANTIAENLSDLVAEVENDNTFSVSLDRLIPAIAPTTPSSPQRPVILGLGLIAGLAAGAIVALLLTRFDRRLRTVAGVRRASGLPVLGMIPRRLLPRRHDSAEPIIRTAMADAMLTIRQANGGGVPRLLLLVPVGKKAPPARIRLALAGAEAATGRDVLLVETESADETANESPVVKDGPGLTELIEGTATLSNSTVTHDGTGIRVLPAGTVETTQLHAETSIRSVVTRLISESDIVIAQSTQSSRPASIALLAPYSDVVVMIARYGRSTDSDLARAVTQLRIVGVRPIGVVLFDVPRNRHIDLSATWQPEDFAAKPAKALNPVRRKAAKVESPHGASVDTAPVPLEADQLDVARPGPEPDTTLSTSSETAEEQVVPG